MKYGIIEVIFIAAILVLNIVPVKSNTNDIRMNFEKLSEINTGNNPFDIQLSNNLVLVSDYYGGLSVFDVTNTSEPKLIDNHPLTHAHYFNIAENYAFVACWEFGIKIINITDPSNLTEVGSYTDGIEVGAVFAANDVAIVSKNDGGVLLLNVSDPTNPQKLYQYNATGVPHVSFIREHIAYVAYFEESGSRIVFLNITNPTSPEFIGQYEDIGANTFDFQLEDDLLVIANYDLGVFFVNISNLANPFKIAEFNTPDLAMGVDVFENYVFVADSNTIEVININDLTNLKIIGSYDDTGVTKEVLITNDLVFACNKPKGLVIFRYIVDESSSNSNVFIYPIIASFIFVIILHNFRKKNIHKG